MQEIGIVNYGAGNVFSLSAALQRQGISFGMVNKASDLTGFKRIIIPGVGQAAHAYAKLLDADLIPALSELNQPVLGICLGMQLFTEHSEEGDQDLLHLFPMQTKSFQIPFKVPHMGWNKIEITGDSPLFSGLSESPHVYFVHSYYVELNPNYTIATCEYGLPFSAAIQKNNYFGVQFHPEKSGLWGETLLKRFSQL